MRGWGFFPFAKVASVISGSETKLKQRLLASGFFDPEYYLREYPDVAQEGFDAALHYIRHGGVEGRNPSERFDAQFYLTKYPDVRANSLNPLIHYLSYGRLEQREIREVPRAAAKPSAPTEQEWAALFKELQPLPLEAAVDVVIPAYRGFDETANCIFKVLQSINRNKQAFRVIVIDDHSPEPALSALLEQLAAKPLIKLIQNETNLGFVASVNKGMSEHKTSDVILLNSDTEVFGDWVDRLNEAAYCDTNIGTVTPLSNNATICSYPFFAADFNGEFELSFSELDELAKHANRGLIVDVPTGVGFCMYIRRECIIEAGTFDTKAFKKGYGEENDFCLRIAKLGWRNVLAGDCFVRHIGKVSFGDSSDALIQGALATLNLRYPTYDQDIARYIRKDPPKSLRKNLDLARLKRAAGSAPFLFVIHSDGGGTLKHARDLATLLAKEGTGVLFLQPELENGNLATLSHPDVRTLSGGNRLDLKHGLQQAVETLRSIGISHIHVHHVLGFALEIYEFIQQLSEALGVPYDFTVHDYLTICPRIDMVDEALVYCENLATEKCEVCISKNGSIFGDVSVWMWRERSLRFLTQARRIYAPNRDVKERIEAIFPTLQVTVRPHPEAAPHAVPAIVPRKKKSPLRVAIFGGISARKGSHVLLEMAKDAAARRLPIHFVLFGYSDRAELAELDNIDIIGSYTAASLPPAVARSKCHVSLFPAVWPETYSYTLSESYFAGLYPVAFDLGAIAERIRACKWGLLLPLELAHRPELINDELLQLNVPERPPEWKPPVGTAAFPGFIESYYGLSVANERESRRAESAGTYDPPPDAGEGKSYSGRGQEPTS